jgi:hypothetical protein
VSKQVIDREKRRGWVDPERCAMAAPAPSRGVIAKACAFGIEHDVPTHLEQVSGALDPPRVEPVFEEVAAEPVTPIEPLGVQAV